MSYFTLEFNPDYALDWSIQAMQSATARVNQTHDPQEAFAAIGEAVWWITIVSDCLRNETLYKESVSSDTTLRGILAGLRSVRNRIGHEVNLVDYLNLEAVRRDQYDDGRIAAWSWKSVLPPKPARRDAADYHRAYEAELAGRNVVEAFSRAQFFLEHVRANRLHRANK